MQGMGTVAGWQGSTALASRGPLMCGRRTWWDGGSARRAWQGVGWQRVSWHFVAREGGICREAQVAMCQLPTTAVHPGDPELLTPHESDLLTQPAQLPNCLTATAGCGEAGPGIRPGRRCGWQGGGAAQWQGDRFGVPAVAEGLPGVRAGGAAVRFQGEGGFLRVLVMVPEGRSQKCKRPAVCVQGGRGSVARACWNSMTECDTYGQQCRGYSLCRATDCHCACSATPSVLVLRSVFVLLAAGPGGPHRAHRCARSHAAGAVWHSLVGHRRVQGNSHGA